MAKNESLPAHLQEKYSRGDDRLTLYERHEKPITCRSRPSLSNPRSTNDIVRAVLRANPILLRSATNRVPTTEMLYFYIMINANKNDIKNDLYKNYIVSRIIYKAIVVKMTVLEALPLH